METVENDMNLQVLNKQEVTITSGIVNKENIRKHLKMSVLNDVISKIDNIKHQTILYSLYFTGVRVSELTKLEKQHIDFDQHTLRIRHLKSRKYYERIIPARKELLYILKSYSASMKYNEKLFAYSRQYIHRIVNRYFIEYGSFGPHMFRHSFAVNFLQQSKSPMGLIILQKLLGHSNIRTTMEYLKIVPNDLENEINKINFF